MEEDLFRKSSLAYANEKDKLDAYIRVTNPGAWFVVTGVFLLLACAAVWTCALSLKTTVPVAGAVNRQEIHVFASAEQAEAFCEGMAVEQDGQKLGVIRKIAEEPVRQEKAGAGYLTEYFRDVRLFEWNVELVVSNDRKLAEGEEIDAFVVTKESRILDLIAE